MSGGNQIRKYLRVDREDHANPLKYNTTSFQNIQLNAITANPITGTQFLSGMLFNGLSPNPITGPSAGLLFDAFAQQTSPVIGEAFYTLVQNTTGVPMVINFGAGYTPATITIPANSTYRMGWELTGLNPPTWTLIQFEPVNVAAALDLKVNYFPTDNGVTHDMLVNVGGGNDYHAATSNTLLYGRVGGLLLGRDPIPGASLTPNNAVLEVHGSDASTNTAQLVRSVVDPAGFPLKADFSCYVASAPATYGGAVTQSEYRGIFPGGMPAAIGGAGAYYLILDVGATHPFWVNAVGHCRVTDSTNAGGGTAFQQDANGALTLTASRREVKENISEMKDTDWLLKVPVRNYNYINDSYKLPRIGGIIDELQTAGAPPACYSYHPKDGKFDMTHPDDIQERSILFSILALVQKQEKRIKELETEIAKLEIVA